MSAPAPKLAPAALASKDWLASTPYRILRELGRGGMGTVFEAEHVALRMPVVVKVLHPQLARQPKFVARLEREARSLARLASPFVVTVSDMGQTSDGVTYLVMERLVGRTLRQELQERAALPLREAIGWTCQVLAGLAAAHRIGIVHRDIKLDNLFLCDATEEEPRRLKLLDFGIAKVLDHPNKRPEGSSHQPTEEGTILGSPRWLAPEQARGKAVDARTDIYAVGVLLYTLIVGRGPFAHHLDPFDAIQAHISEEPLPPSRPASQFVPPELDQAILMALAKLPQERFQSAQAFSRALDTIAARLGDITQPLTAVATQSTTREAAPVTASAVAGIAASMAGVAYQSRAISAGEVAGGAVDGAAITAVPLPAIEDTDGTRESAAPTLVQGPSCDPAAAYSAAGDVSRLRDPSADALRKSSPRAATFIALVAASTVVFFILLGSAVRFFGPG